MLRRTLDSSNDVFGMLKGDDPQAGGVGRVPYEVPPPPPSFPAAPEPDPGAGKEGRSAETPRERRPAQEATPPDVSRVSMAPSAAPEGQGAAPSMAAPATSMEPSPVSAGPPQPFTPMAGHSPEAMAGMGGGVSRVPLGGAAPASPTLFGRAGGMLGGGLGVPGGGTDATAQPDISHLMQLLKLLGVQ